MNLYRVFVLSGDLNVDRMLRCLGSVFCFLSGDMIVHRILVVAKLLPMTFWASLTYRSLVFIRLLPPSHEC